MDFWYHGTPEYFDKWATPPVTVKFKPELEPHPFISLSRDMMLVRGASEGTGGLCRARLKDNACVLDLRNHSNDNFEVWKMVLCSENGNQHLLVQSYNLWMQSCRNGEILRLLPINAEYSAYLQNLIRIAHSEAYPFKQRNEAHLIVQNVTRKWINVVITPARQLGFHAVICNEIDSYRETGPTACLNLYVLNTNMLTDPEWISVPHSDVTHQNQSD